jgi:hypothetical protein
MVQATVLVRYGRLLVTISMGFVENLDFSRDARALKSAKAFTDNY